MSTNIQQKLESAIEIACKKIQAQKESDICRYLPGPNGEYIHHFTFKKMKETEPEQCLSLIEKSVLNISEPRELAPKPRAPRGTNKNSSQFKLPVEVMNHVMKIAREIEDDTLLSKLQAFRPLAQIKQELIRSIRDNAVKPELWEAYKDAMMLNTAEPV